MTLREFLEKLIEEAPSRGLDETDIYISDPDGDESYKIVDITNHGNNDEITIEVRKC